MGATLLSKRKKALGRWRKKRTKIIYESAGIHLDEAVGF
jgi:hypothetical protein